MSIRFKIIGSLAIFAGMMLALSVSQVFLINDLNLQVQREAKVIDLVKGIFELNLVTNEYILEGSQNSAEEWLARYFSLLGLFTNDLATNEAETRIYLSMEKNYKDLGEIFRDLVAIRGGTFDTDILNGASALEREQMLLAEIAEVTKSIVADSFNFTNAAKNRVVTSITTTIISIQIFAIGTAVLGSGGSYIVYKAITKPLTVLTESANSIAKGRLDVEIDSKLLRGKDEFSTLARSFSLMANELSHLYDDLEQRVDNRTNELFEAQQKLKEKLSELERLNSVLVGRELKMIELKEKIRELTDKTDGQAS